MKQKTKIIYDKCLFVKEHKKIFSIVALTKILNISKQTYYSWINNNEPSYLMRFKYDLKLLNTINSLFYENKEKYGAPRLLILLKKLGYKTTFKKVQRAMKYLNLCAKVRIKKQKYKKITVEKQSHTPDLVCRNFNPEKRNKIWVTDITELKVKDTKYYISCVMDLFSREIIGQAIRPYKGYNLVEESMMMAIKNSNIMSWQRVIVHSDNGSEYKSYNWKLLLMDFNAQISMSRVGNCLDNSVIESFHAVLKTEGLKKKYVNTKELLNDFENFIIWYNTKRINVKNGLAPVDIV